MILVVDNYDSFTYNLVQLLRRLGSPVEVVRNDEVSPEAAVTMQPSGVLISPGPCGPREAGISPEVVRRLSGSVPVLGVCLGHQIIADVFGGRVERSPRPVHGHPVPIQHDGLGVLEGLPNPFTAVRYHSLCVDEGSLPPELEVSARSDDGVVQGLRHRTLQVEGVQFHPESILSEGGEAIIANFLRATRGKRRRDAG